MVSKTIAAISTAPGIGGIGIIRMSGEDCFEILEKIFDPIKKEPIESIKGYTMKFGFIHDKEGNRIDEVLVSFFKSPKSYTTENMCEINSHGGLVIMNQILDYNPISNGDNRGNNGNSPTDKIVKAFAFLLIIFAICLIGIGIYNKIQNNSSGNDEVVAETKANIVTEKDGENLIIKVTHDKKLTKLTYNWNALAEKTLAIETGHFELNPNEEMLFPKEGSIPFIPQSGKAWNPVILPQHSEGCYLLLNCKVSNEVTIWGDEKGNCAEAAIPLSIRFKSDEPSVIVLTLAPNCPWYDTQGSSPQPLFVPITFDVSVEDWKE